MATLPQKLPLPQMQTQWASQLNPVLGNPLLNGQLLMNIPLKGSGDTTVINHGLGRILTGWIIVGIDGEASIWTNQSKNQRPQLTLQLVSTMPVNVNLWVF
jgi:hypothetical protein